MVVVVEVVGVPAELVMSSGFPFGMVPVGMTGFWRIISAFIFANSACCFLQNSVWAAMASSTLCM